MKKFLAMILVAMMVVMTGAAFAEWDPMADAIPEENTVEEAAAEEPAVEAPADDAAADAAAPEGYKLYQYEPYIVADYGTIIMESAEYVETATALNPAEHSVKFPASNGNLMLQIRLLYHPMTDDQNYTTAFECDLIADAEYPARRMVESAVNSIDDVQKCVHYGPYMDGDATAYLVNIVGTNQNMSVNSGNSNATLSLAYYLYDYIAEVPASLAESGTPVYLQLDVNGTALYYQVQ